MQHEGLQETGDRPKDPHRRVGERRKSAEDCMH